MSWRVRPLRCWARNGAGGRWAGGQVGRPVPVVVRGREPLLSTSARPTADHHRDTGCAGESTPHGDCTPEAQQRRCSHLHMPHDHAGYHRDAHHQHGCCAATASSEPTCTEAAATPRAPPARKQRRLRPRHERPQHACPHRHRTDNRPAHHPDTQHLTQTHSTSRPAPQRHHPAHPWPTATPPRYKRNPSESSTSPIVLSYCQAYPPLRRLRSFTVLCPCSKTLTACVLDSGRAS